MALIAVWLPALGVPFRGFLDFSAFYVAAQFAFTPDVVRLDPIVLAQDAAGLPISPYLYTPLFALLFVPLSWLPYQLAGLVNLALMFGALLVASILIARLYGLSRRIAIVSALAWSPAAASVLSGQNASFGLVLVVVIGILMLWAESMASPRSAIAAGLTLSLLAYKPQFALPVVGLALLRERWLVVATVIVGLIGHYLLAAAVAGGNLAWPVDWLTTLTRYSAVDLETNGWQAISLPALLARVPISLLGENAPAGLQGLALVGYALATLVIVLCVPAMRRMPLPRALALAACLGLLIMPHAWVYNATLLLPALAVLAVDAWRRGWPWQDRWLFAAIYAIGLVWPLGRLVGVTLLPIIVIAMPALLVGWGPFRRSQPAGSSRRPFSAGSGTGTASSDPPWVSRRSARADPARR
jgi:hypothetical protein